MNSPAGSERLPVATSERLEVFLQRIARLDGELRAFISIDPTRAREEARQSDRRLQAGQARPLEGLILGVKDCIDVAGLACTVGSRFFEDYWPERDAPLIERLRLAGAIVLGKTNLHEFCYGGTSQNEHYGHVRNPWDRGCLPGGSSGGSAAAVAAGWCDAALGTDTGSSIRMPAALCGVVGLRPTVGSVPCEGVFPVSPPYDVPGPLARTVRQVRQLYGCMSRPEAGPPASFPPGSVASGSVASGGFAEDQPGQSTRLKGLRVGMPLAVFRDDADPAVADCVLRAAGVLERLGAQLVELRLPGVALAQSHLNPVIYADAAQLHRERLRDSPQRFGVQVRTRLQPGLALLAVDYAACLRWIEAWRQEVAGLFSDQVDVVLTPTVGMTAPRASNDASALAATARLSHLCWAWPAAGVPAISIGCGFVEGLPVGMQLAASWGREATLFRAGEAYQAATDWHRLWPEL